jgi:pyruvate/2-oxoglutarate dehydrogenase complex dihydrolipoamide dehydrogenase (E3) component
MTTNCDAIVIGGGQAGPFLAERLARQGMNGSVIERKLFGGTCTNTGWSPRRITGVYL